MSNGPEESLLISKIRSQTDPHVQLVSNLITRLLSFEKCLFVLTSMLNPLRIAHIVQQERLISVRMIH